MTNFIAAPNHFLFLGGSQPFFCLRFVDHSRTLVRMRPWSLCGGEAPGRPQIIQPGLHLASSTLQKQGGEVHNAWSLSFGNIILPPAFILLRMINHPAICALALPLMPVLGLFPPELVYWVLVLEISLS